MTVELGRFQENLSEETQRFARVRQFASWVVSTYTLPEIDKNPALRHDFPNQQSQVPNFQYHDWFERQTGTKQVGFAD